MKSINSFFLTMLCVAALATPAAALAGSATLSDNVQASPAAGRPSGGRYGQHRHHHGMYGMLRTLDLSQQQQDQIKALFGAYRKAHPEGSQADPAARKQLRDQIMAVLTPAQRAKLESEKQAWKNREKSEGVQATPTH